MTCVHLEQEDPSPNIPGTACRYLLKGYWFLYDLFWVPCLWERLAAGSGFAAILEGAAFTKAFSDVLALTGS